MINKKIPMLGSVSVFFSLILILVLSVVLFIFDAARSVSQKTALLDISDISSKSLAGLYCKELFDEYGVFSIYSSDIDLNKTLKEYTNSNLSGLGMLSTSLKSIDTHDIKSLVDNDGYFFSNQIIDFMKYYEIKNIKDSISNALDIYHSTNTDLISDDLISDDLITNDSINSDLFDSNNTSSGYDSSINFFDLIKEKIRLLLKDELMLIVFENTSALSNNTIDKNILPSLTSSLSAEQISIHEGYIEDPEPYITSERIWFAEYISMFFSNYLSSSGNGSLNYEIEYIINGSDSDIDNLYNTTLKLVAMRATLNACHIFSSSQKLTEIRNIASYLSANIPVAYAVIETTLISSWSIAEAVIDVKDLYHGKKVQIIKDSSHWTLSINNITKLNKDTISKNDGNYGYDYSFYLKLLLTAQEEICLRFRTMDLIQDNICQKYNDTFRLSNCICEYDSSFVYKSNYIFANIIPYSSVRFPNEYTINTHYNYSE